MDTAQEILSELIKIPSVSSQDNSPIIQKISTYFEKYEQKMQEWKRWDDTPGKNLIVKIPGKDSSSSLVFACHMDTVPSSSKWETDPFSLIEKDEKLYGLGSCDTKGGTAALISAVLNISSQPLYDTFLVFSGDEEVSCSGMHKLKEDLFFNNPKFIFLEPTDHKVLISQRGLAGMEIELHGEAQHGSYATPEKNKEFNAIYKMSKMVQMLIEDAEKLAEEQDLLLGSNTQNLGVIQGGTARNVMADTCTVGFDRRLLPSHNPEKEIERLSEMVKNMYPDAKIGNTDVLPSFSTDKNAPLVSDTLKILYSMFQDAGLGGFQAWSEAGLFSDFKEVIILGPGSIEQAHRANEYVSKQDLEIFVNIFKEIIIGI